MEQGFGGFGPCESLGDQTQQTALNGPFVVDPHKSDSFPVQEITNNSEPKQKTSIVMDTGPLSLMIYQNAARSMVLGDVPMFTYTTFGDFPWHAVNLPECKPRSIGRMPIGYEKNVA